MVRPFVEDLASGKTLESISRFDKTCVSTRLTLADMGTGEGVYRKVKEVSNISVFTEVA